MDYYEELGIKPTATDDEIRRAHHRMVKLFHPDQQTDEEIKSLAETQMRRVNSIVEILYDPERRRLYDRQLREARADGVGLRPQHRFRRSLPWWAASTVGAIALTLAAVWFWADNWGSSFGNHAPTNIPSEATTESPAAQPAAAPPAPSADLPAKPPLASAPATVDSAPPPPSRTIAAVPASTRSAKAPHVNAKLARVTPPPSARPSPARKRFNLVNANVSAHVHAAAPDLPPPPSVPASAPRADPVGIPVASIPEVTAKFAEPATGSKRAGTPSRTKTRPANSLEGEWVYAPTEPEKGKAGFYPPEFIDLKLFATDNGLHGEYRARYHVVDRPIPPNVEFTLAPDGTNKFVWKSGNGSKGTLKISSMDPTSIRIEWRTTVFSNGPALTAGTATLVRRAQ